MRKSRMVAVILIFAVLVAGCGSGRSAPAANPKPMSLSALVAQMPIWQGTISFTHWAALSHYAAPAGMSGFTPDWVAHADGFRRTTGVDPAAMDWQLDQGDGQYLQILTQWTDGAALAKVVRALTQHGWHAAAQGRWTALTRASPYAADGWEWAFRQDFLVDQERGLLLSHVGNEAAREPTAGSTFAGALGAALLARAQDLTVGQLRVTSASCSLNGLLEANPRPPRSVFLQFATAIGGLGQLEGLIVGETTADGRQGVAEVAATSPAQAAAEIARRAGARARWDTAFGTRYGVTVTAWHQDGSLETFTLRARTAADLPNTVREGALGVDGCGIN